MNTATGSSQPRPKRKLGCLGVVGIVVLAIAVIGLISGIVSSVQTQQWAANSGSRTVAVTGTLTGDGWEIASTGEVKTDSQYSETSFVVHVSRVGDASRRTPTFKAILGDNNDGDNQCETFRSYIWDTNEGSDIEVKCTYYLTLDELKKVHTVEITDGL